MTAQSRSCPARRKPDFAVMSDHTMEVAAAMQIPDKRGSCLPEPERPVFESTAT